MADIVTTDQLLAEIADYWNTEHLRKIQLRPRKGGEKHGK